MDNSCGRHCYQYYQYASHDFYYNCRSQLNPDKIKLGTGLNLYQEFRNQACGMFPRQRTRPHTHILCTYSSMIIDLVCSLSFSLPTPQRTSQPVPCPSRTATKPSSLYVVASFWHRNQQYKIRLKHIHCSQLFCTNIQLYTVLLTVQ